MIPKRAIFFWEGPEMSWLRRQSIETFGLCNPGWELVLIDGSGTPIPKNGFLSIVHRSDWARYAELHENGGFYFDTDIVFCNPIPAEWVESELVLPITDDDCGGRVGHVATLGCQPGEPFFADALGVCRQTWGHSKILNYQAFGVEALRGAKRMLSGRDVTWITPDATVPIPWDQTECIWNPFVGEIPPFTYGVHWFGGDHLSMAIERDTGEAWLDESTSIVAKAIKRARAIGQSGETLRRDGHQEGIQA